MQMLPMSNGIFTHINYQFPTVLSITNQQLDLSFLTLYGLRLCAPVIHVVHTSDSQYLSQEELTTLGALILSTYKYKWDRLAAILSLQYDPIHNYSDTYHEVLSDEVDTSSTRTPNITVANNESLDIDTVVTDGGSERKTLTSSDSSTRTDNLSEQTTKTTTDTNTRTDNLTENVSSEGENNLFGFNSNDAVGANTDASDTTRTNTGTVEDSRSVSDSSTRTNTGTVGDSRQSSGETTLYGGLTHTTDDSHVTSGTKRTTGTETNETSSDRDRVRDFTHIGNIGNITTQQLLNQEIELWRWNFIQQVLNDVKDFLTLPLYD